MLPVKVDLITLMASHAIQASDLLLLDVTIDITKFDWSIGQCRYLKLLLNAGQDITLSQVVCRVNTPARSQHCQPVDDKMYYTVRK